jgi:hypothetical protein
MLECYQKKEKFRPIFIKINSFEDLEDLYDAIEEYSEGRETEEIKNNILHLSEELGNLYNYWNERK